MIRASAAKTTIGGDGGQGRNHASPYDCGLRSPLWNRSALPVRRLLRAEMSAFGCVLRCRHLSTVATAGQRPTVAGPSMIRHVDVEVAALCLDRHAADPHPRHAHTTTAFSRWDQCRIHRLNSASSRQTGGQIRMFRHGLNAPRALHKS
jgi:hypothetical protein